MKDHKTTASAGTFGQEADIRGKEVFDNPELCAQFLRGYSGIPLLENVRAEDIEDMAGRYHQFNEVELSSDSVKKINMHGKTGEGIPLYVVSLIDHKGSVDYDVSMQFLQYMAGIWADWRKEMKGNGLDRHKNKDFRYPPVFPIVYYEGERKWTAGLHLKDRIMMSDVFEEYIPDFKYKLVRVHDYTNEELLAKEDVMSFLMALMKIRDAKDFKEVRGLLSPERLEQILGRVPGDVLDLAAAVIWNLCRRMHVPEKEAAEYISKVKERDMGYLFENMEEMDIQEERRKTREQKARTEEERKRADEQEKRADELERRAEEREKDRQEQGISAFVNLGKRCGQEMETIIQEVSEEFGLDMSEARKKTEQYWEKPYKRNTAKTQE